MKVYRFLFDNYSGIGITAEAQRCLFRAFSQATSSNLPALWWCGAGLSISKDLVFLVPAAWECMQDALRSVTPTTAELADGAHRAVLLPDLIVGKVCDVKTDARQPESCQ